MSSERGDLDDERRRKLRKYAAGEQRRDELEQSDDRAAGDAVRHPNPFPATPASEGSRAAGNRRRAVVGEPVLQLVCQPGMVFNSLLNHLEHDRAERRERRRRQRAQ